MLMTMTVCSLIPDKNEFGLNERECVYLKHLTAEPEAECRRSVLSIIMDSSVFAVGQNSGLIPEPTSGERGKTLRLSKTTSFT